MEASRADVEFYILDAAKRTEFMDEIKEFEGLWKRSPNFHSIIFGFPDPIIWPGCRQSRVEKLCNQFGLHEVKPGVFSDGFDKESH